MSTFPHAVSCTPFPQADGRQGQDMRLRTAPLALAEANRLIVALHRHHGPVRFHLFTVGCWDASGALRGAAVVHRPCARALDTGDRLEVSRCVTDGCPNACSALYGAAWREARHRGYLSIQTYIRTDELGTSLLAAGWRLVNVTDRPRSWGRPGTEPTGRQRWERSIVSAHSIYCDRGRLAPIQG